MFFFVVDKDRAIALIRENNIREMLYLTHSRKFSPAKISRYTVVQISWLVNMGLGWIDNSELPGTGLKDSFT